MHEDMKRIIGLPKGVPTARYIPPAQVNVPEGTSELPLIDQNHPSHRKVQEIWIAKLKLFDLSKDDEVVACEAVWQAVTDGKAKLAESQVVFDPKRGTFVHLLRWIALEYRLPSPQA
jgi:hypothetical protein